MLGAGIIDWCGQLPERVGYDGAGDGHRRAPVRRVHCDDADDPVVSVRADDAGGLAPCRRVGRHRERDQVGKLTVLVGGNRDGDVVPAGLFVHAGNHKSDSWHFRLAFYPGKVRGPAARARVQPARSRRTALPQAWIYWLVTVVDRAAPCSPGGFFHDPGDLTVCGDWGVHDHGGGVRHRTGTAPRCAAAFLLLAWSL
jgi:hypothetical protein